MNGKRTVRIVFVLGIIALLVIFGIKYVTNDKVAVTVKNDLNDLDKPTLIHWKREGILSSFTIEPKFGDKTDSVYVKAYVYKGNELVSSEEICRTARDYADSMTVQLYSEEAVGFKVDAMGSGAFYTFEIPYDELDNLPGYGTMINDKLSVTNEGEESVIAVFFVGNTTTEIKNFSKEKVLEKYSKNPLTVIYTLGHQTQPIND